ncbi:MAG TPA: Rrf2 family transcriptional regulator [Syntrophothermus lipocalidus]|uniref:RrF2 family transcriptional regulator n=1 Tax=Syntrophothermus sp. TaxID=2736299 RepID=UPI001699E253|nr:Rrf2 family transcriptional regulator [Syntrophothermus sp.]NLU48973.1 Rrf2 family transcriptional regulator [Syntrophomonadaceae bacterium]NSW81769.1 Rrf2 family transcriptional regulator [Syntrophothermus sp.]HHV77257.1 Rrf2 family transcriptional regulator [Syntrophothermus lipocalidus]
MKMSTKGRYGLRAMLDMAIHQNEGPIAVHSIAERQGLSDRYLEQLMVPLKKAGLVKSVRGPQGGYVLAKEPKDITVGEIIRTLEGPIAPVDCVSEDYPEECERAEYCVTRLIWSKVRDSIAEVLDSFSLEDLVQESRRISTQNRYMYYI